MKKLLPSPAILGGAFLLSSCATHVYSLNPQASRVQLVEYLTPEARASLQEITMVKCELGMNGNTQEGNMESCQNEMRNKASELGGVVVLIEPEKQQIGKVSTNFFYCRRVVSKLYYNARDRF